MSEYIRTRRHAITDVASFLGFFFGFLISAPIVFLSLRTRFEDGDLEGGLMKFALTVLGVSLLCGIGGYIGGWVLGWGYEGSYRLYRHFRPPRVEGVSEEAAAVAVRAPDADARRETHSPAPDPAARSLPPLPPLRYDEGFPPAAFLALAARVWPGSHDPALAASALQRTTNIGAWDGDRLVGTVRMLTDGYFVATIPDLFVDPDYRRRGVGRELMRRALEASPRGSLFIGARPESVVFFKRIGCEVGPAGYVMRREGRRG
jgi:GNAT superfamily N-acetyltransferase